MKQKTVPWDEATVKDTPRKIIDSRPLGDMNTVKQALNGSCRSTVESLLRKDPDFPAPFTIGRKRLWFMDEIETYKESRPRRQYADPVA